MRAEYNTDALERCLHFLCSPTIYPQLPNMRTCHKHNVTGIATYGDCPQCIKEQTPAMITNNTTPRTDAEQKWTFGDNRPGMSFDCVKVEFTEGLERELNNAERRFQFQKDENDNRIRQIRKLQQDLADAENPKILGMAADLNLELQNKCDMWRDEFARIKAIECSRPGVVESEIIGICDRAMLDIRSKISLIDQREKAADMIAKLNEEATATEELLRTYGWKEEESLQMFLHRTRMPANPLKHSPEYLAVLLQSCEEKLLQAGAALKAIFDATDPYADGAPEASAHDKLCNEISALARPWRRGYSENNEVSDRAGEGRRS
jgi:hypothetical protein